MFEETKDTRSGLMCMTGLIATEGLGDVSPLVAAGAMSGLPS